MEILNQLQLQPGTFSGRVAVVTGGARGIGEHVGACLAHLGATVILLDMREEGASTAERLRGNQRRVEFAHIDLRDMAALERFQRDALAEYGRIDILVNNASKLKFEHFQEASTDLWEDLHQTTVRASAYLAARFMPKMIEQGFGIICNTLAPEVFSYATHFAAAMAGQRAMALSLAGEVPEDSGVSVFGFVPGVVDTPLVREQVSTIPKFFGMSQEERLNETISLPGYDGDGYARLMPADHCAAAYVYCLAHAPEYHGQIADAFQPLIEYGVVTPKDGELRPKLPTDRPMDRQLDDYIQGVATEQRNLETRIVERTKELEGANRKLAQQSQRFEDISAKISRYLPRQVYESIFAGEFDADIGHQRKNLTVCFTDLCDFAHKTERLEPEALSEILNRYFSEMTEIARSHGATIDKFIGDAIMIFFGDPNTQGPTEDACACVAMAIEMQQHMAAITERYDRLGLNDPLKMRVGINSGYCTVGNFGSYERVDYTIFGSPVNIASRLQEIGDPGSIWITKNTQALIKSQFTAIPLGGMRLKGIVDEVQAYNVEFDLQGGKQSDPAKEDQVLDLATRLQNIDVNALSTQERDELLRTISKLLDQ